MILTPITDEEMGYIPPTVKRDTLVGEVGFRVKFYTWGVTLAPKVWEDVLLEMTEDFVLEYCVQYLDKRNWVFGCEIYHADNMNEAYLVCDVRKGIRAHLLPSVQKVVL